MLEELKKKVCTANKELFKNNLVTFSWGNVSGIDREKNLIAVKASGVSLKDLSPEDIVIVDMEGKVIEGDKKPSVDIDAHLVLYKNFENIKSVVHAHSTYLTIHAQAKKPILCLGTTHADYFYGKVPVSRDLSDEEINNGYEANTGKAIVETLGKNKLNPDYCRACLVASHGPFVWGDSVQNALQNAVALEQIAKMNLHALKLNPATEEIPKVLLDKHFLRKHGKNAYYGQKSDDN